MLVQLFLLKIEKRGCFDVPHLPLLCCEDRNVIIIMVYHRKLLFGVKIWMLEIGD